MQCFILSQVKSFLSKCNKDINLGKKKKKDKLQIFSLLLNLISTWVNELPGHVFKAADLFLLRSVNYHGGGAQDAEQAAELPVQV